MVSATTPRSDRPGSSVSRLLDRWGIPAPLFLGYVGLLLFMIGDGIESGFIAPFIADNGAGTEVRASYVITVYGVAVVLASWLSGALSGPRRPRRVVVLGLAGRLGLAVRFLPVAGAGADAGRV